MISALPLFDIDPLDVAALVAGRGGAGMFSPLAFMNSNEPPLMTWAVADRFVRPDRRAVGAAAGVAADLLAPVGKHPGQRLALDLGQDGRPIGHGDRSLREPKAFGDELYIRGVLHTRSGRSWRPCRQGGGAAPDWRRGRAVAVPGARHQDHRRILVVRATTRPLLERPRSILLLIQRRRGHVAGRIGVDLREIRSVPATFGSAGVKRSARRSRTPRPCRLPPPVRGRCRSLRSGRYRPPRRPPPEHSGWRVGTMFETAPAVVAHGELSRSCSP